MYFSFNFFWDFSKKLKELALFLHTYTHATYKKKLLHKIICLQKYGILLLLRSILLLVLSCICFVDLATFVIILSLFSLWFSGFRSCTSGSSEGLNLFGGKLVEDRKRNRIVSLEIDLSDFAVLDFLLQEMRKSVVNTMNNVLHDILDVHICSSYLDSAAS